MKNSEFEVLRQKYQATAGNGQPQIKIIKKPQNRTTKNRFDTRLSQTGLIGAGHCRIPMLS
ncbi:hypothetical protein [Psychrosphaera algicola]|uniref:Uncharacterized protein n=1 Tax=Psychrosphaera algicola TaxID=3023714 RepID=A0ABT5FCU4_9GAMM|nr:hypothetical protein [Psychrosphaera sp. G1-22]MDC2889368.1 hypothetical protein [Psychrosphaera sp. G1-22]